MEESEIKYLIKDTFLLEPVCYNENIYKKINNDNLIKANIKLNTLDTIENITNLNIKYIKEYNKKIELSEKNKLNKQRYKLKSLIRENKNINNKIEKIMGKLNNYEYNL